jgi:hypothetical protein
MAGRSCLKNGVASLARSRPKDGVASLAYGPGHPRIRCFVAKVWMPGTRPGMTADIDAIGVEKRPNPSRR